MAGLPRAPPFAFRAVCEGHIDCCSPDTNCLEESMASPVAPEAAAAAGTDAANACAAEGGAGAP